MKHLPPIKNYHSKKWDERAQQDRKLVLERRFWAQKNRQALMILQHPMPLPSHATMIFFLHGPELLDPIAMHPNIPNAFRVGTMYPCRPEILEWLTERGLTNVARPVHHRPGVDLLFTNPDDAVLFKMTFF